MKTYVLVAVRMQHDEALAELQITPERTSAYVDLLSMI